MTFERAGFLLAAAMALAGLVLPLGGGTNLAAHPALLIATLIAAGERRPLPAWPGPL